jgi:threonine dehydrogenase-like Zn-dependent dehydrogenase
LNNALVLENQVLFGSVNANRRHFEAALVALARAPQAWLQRLIQRHVPIERFQDAFKREPGDVKVVIDWPAIG